MKWFTIGMWYMTETRWEDKKYVTVRNGCIEAWCLFQLTLQYDHLLLMTGNTEKNPHKSSQIWFLLKRKTYLYRHKFHPPLLPNSWLPGISECGFIGKQALCRCDYLRWGHTGLGWTLTPVTSVLMWQGQDTEKPREEGPVTMEAEWNNAGTSPGPPKSSPATRN